MVQSIGEEILTGMVGPVDLMLNCRVQFSSLRRLRYPVPSDCLPFHLT